MRIVRQTCVRWRRLARRALVGLLLIIGAPAVALGQTERVEYYALDAIGSVRVVFDASGNILGRMDFGPFGMDLNGATGMPPERFAGLTRDGEAGLDYAQARMYQSRTGRFGAPDPVYAGMLDPQQWNRYAYAANSPTTLSDPTGLCAECQWVTDRELNIFVLSLYRFLPNDTQNPPTKEKNLRGSGRRGTPPETPGDPDPPPPPPGDPDPPPPPAPNTGSGAEPTDHPDLRWCRAALCNDPRIYDPANWKYATVPLTPGQLRALAAIKDWLGPGAWTIRNVWNDLIAISRDGTRKVRFDINHTYPHASSHSHVEALQTNGKWIKSGPIYPPNIPGGGR